MTEPPQKRSNLFSADFLNFFVSALAMLIAGFSLYFSNFWVNNRAYAHVFDAEIGPASSAGDQYGWSIRVDVDFYNAGNRTAIIVDPPQILIRCESAVNGSSGGIDPEPGIDDKFPLLLKPQDVSAIALDIPRSAILEGSSNDPACALAGNAKDPSERSYYLALRYHALDFEGSVDSVRTAAQIRVDADSQSINGVGIVDDPTTPLFK
jgi:hypothetical protein